MLYHIIDNIYLSNLISAENFKLIEQHSIGVVCRLSEDRNKTIYGPNIKFHNYEVEDNIIAGNDMLLAASEICKIIDNSECNVLVHCNEGQSRSASVIIYYLITRYNKSYEEALQMLKNIKHDVRPNEVFEKKLRKCATVLQTLQQIHKL